jgi:hypothetical protein
MVELDLDPERISTVVLRRGAKQRRFLSEAIRELSRQVVHAVYAALLEDDAGVPGQEAAFRRSVLGRLRDLDCQVAAAPVRAAGPAPAELREVFRGVLERHVLFAGRDRELGVLEHAATELGASGTGRYVCVSAPAGFGKSALLANWVSRLDGAEDLAFAFVNRLAGTDDETTVLRALCQQLLPGELPPGEDATDFRARLGRLLREPPRGRPSIVVVDGLDEAAWLTSGLFPPAPPAGRLIVLSRRAWNDDWMSDLGLERTSVTPLVLGTLTAEDIASLLRAAGDPAAAFADDPAFIKALHEVTVYEGVGDHPYGDPLYVRLLVEDVREGRISALSDLTGQPAGLKTYFDRWWEEITAALTGAVLRDLLGYLLMAKGPISRAELAAIDDNDALDEFGADGAPPLEDALERTRRFLAGDDDRGLVLGHPRFAAYLRDTRFSAKLTDAYNARLRAYCARWRDVHLLGPYAVTHYVEHLSDQGTATERRAVLADPRFISTKARECGIDPLLADYALDPPGDATVTAVGRALRRSRMALAREPDQLAAQLYGRLVGSADAAIERLLDGLAAVAPPYWLAERTPALTSERELDATLTHVGTVRALAFGALEGRTMLAVGVDDRISLHDPQKGTSEQATIGNDGCRVTALCLATIGARPVLVVVAGYDLQLVVRDAAGGGQVGDSVTLPGHVDSVTVGTLGDTLVIAAAGGGSAWAWDSRSREPVEITNEGVGGEVTGVTTVDGRVTYTVMAVRDDRVPEIVLVDAASLREVSMRVSHALEPKAVAVSTVGRALVLAFLWQPALCGLWSGETGEAIGAYLDLGDADVRCHAVGEIEGRQVVAASLDYESTGVILLREAGTTGRPARQRPIKANFDGPIHAFRADPSGTITTLAGRVLALHEVHGGENPLTKVNHLPSEELVASMLTGTSEPLSFTRAIGGPGHDSVRLVGESDLGARGTADAEHLLRGEPLQWPATSTQWAAVDGRAVLAIGSYAGAVWLWNIADGSLMAGPFADVPDELFVASRRVKAARPPHVTSIAIEYTGRCDTLAAACGGAVRMWDARTGEQLPAPDASDEVVVALALGMIRARAVLVSGSRGGVVRVWDATGGGHLAAISLDAGVEGVWVVRDGDAVAALTGDGQLHVMDLRDERLDGDIATAAPQPPLSTPS